MSKPNTEKRWGGKFRVVKVTNGHGQSHYVVDRFTGRIWAEMDETYDSEFDATCAADRHHCGYLGAQTTREVVVE